MGVRFASGIFNTALGVLLLASVPWLGPLAWLGLLPLAGAALIFWTARRLQASAQVNLSAPRGGTEHPAEPENFMSNGDTPVLMRLLVRSWEYRRPRLATGVRVASGVFNVALGVALLAAAPWVGPLAALAALPLAGAALIFWTVHRLQQDSLRRVNELERSRAHLVDDSAARLRRIERDLHDGAQAQMVAVAMKLGLAREKLCAAIERDRSAPTWSGSWIWSTRPTAAPRKPSASCGTWPAASSRRSSTTASAPRSPPWPRAATYPSS